ncbi:MAG: hypothetical protein M1822_007762 [Bathelium mastoideum]|nr:MAG: hypothetical protein M1822_007762 [Bathelium mastoideum]
MPSISYREHVSSASRVPSTSRERLTSPIRAPSIAQDPEEELSWRELYQKQQEAFELKDDINKRERRKLQAELTRLQSELLVERSKSKQLELALETAKVTRNGSRSRDTSKDTARNPSYSSDDSLRKLSDSIGFTASPSAPLPPSTTNGNYRLSSISEVAGESSPKVLQWMDQQARGGSIFAQAAHLAIGGDGSNNVSPNANSTPRAVDTDDPRSPPSSTAIMSPPPSKNRAYAGHTPLKAEAMSVSSTPGGQDTPTARNTHRNAEAPVPLEIDPVHDVHEDPALTGPLGLPTNPENGGDVIINALDEKLQDAAQFPGHSRPTVLQGTISEDGDGSEAHAEDPPTPLATSAEEAAAVDAGPKLKVKRSMNFGAPIGALPGKPF